MRGTHPIVQFGTVNGGERMKYEYGRVVINTFNFPLFWVDVVCAKGNVTLVFDLGWFSVAFRLIIGEPIPLEV